MTGCLPRNKKEKILLRILKMTVYVIVLRLRSPVFDINYCSPLTGPFSTVIPSKIKSFRFLQSYFLQARRH